MIILNRIFTGTFYNGFLINIMSTSLLLKERLHYDHTNSQSGSSLQRGQLIGFIFHIPQGCYYGPKILLIQQILSRNKDA